MLIFCRLSHPVLDHDRGKVLRVGEVFVFIRVLSGNYWRNLINFRGLDLVKRIVDCR